MTPHFRLYSSTLLIATQLIALFLSCARSVSGSMGHREAKVTKKEEAKQALVSKLAEQFGRSVRPHITFSRARTPLSTLPSHASIHSSPS